jgi:predicted RNA binding protein YcfA (HicA-like mRNA interferase family)
MMARRTLDRAHTAREVNAHFEHHPALIDVRQNGSHRTYRGPNGSVIVPCHNGDIARGTLRSIVRMAALAGLAALAVAALIGAL